MIVGVGSRARMYMAAINETFKSGNELVAICDTNPGRLDTALRFMAPTGVKPGKYLASDFDAMIRRLLPAE